MTTWAATGYVPLARKWRRLADASLFTLHRMSAQRRSADAVLRLLLLGQDGGRLLDEDA